MNNLNLYKFKEQEPIDYFWFLLISFIIIPNFYNEIPENIKNLISKYQDNPKALLDNQEIKDFAYLKYNEIREAFNELKSNYENLELEKYLYKKKHNGELKLKTEKKMLDSLIRTGQNYLGQIR